MLKLATSVRGWQSHSAANRGAQTYDVPVAFCLMGIRHHGSVPSSESTTKIPGG